MKVITKTPKKVVLEITEAQILEFGFDVLWDKVRNLYPVTSYELFQVNKDKDNSKIIYIELMKKS